jgi:SAM-dependent methyltransferase
MEPSSRRITPVPLDPREARQARRAYRRGQPAKIPRWDELERRVQPDESVQRALEQRQHVVELAEAGDPTARLYVFVNELTAPVYTQVETRDVDESAVSLVYSELTLASARELFDRFSLNEDRSFLDIGSGFGRLVLHAVLERGVRPGYAKGIEFDPLRVAQSRRIQRLVADRTGRDDLRDAGSLFQRGDITKQVSLDYDCIFFYNVTAPLQQRIDLYRILLNSRFQLYADCFAPDEALYPYLELVQEFRVVDDGGDDFPAWMYRPRVARPYRPFAAAAAPFGITEKEALQTAGTRIAIARRLEPDDWHGLYALQFAVRDTPLDEAEILAFDQLWRAHCYRRYGEALPRCLENFEGIRRALIQLQRPQAIPTYWFVTFRLLSVLLRVGTLSVFALFEHAVWVGYPETRRLDGRGQLGLPLLRQEARRIPLSSYALPSPPVLQSPFLLDYGNTGAGDELQARVTIDDPYAPARFVLLNMDVITGDGGQTLQGTVREGGVDAPFVAFSRVGTTEVMLTHVGAETGLRLVFQRGLWANARIQTYVTQGLSLLRAADLDSIALAEPYDWLNVLARAALDPDADTAPETLAFMEQGGPMTFYYGGRRRDMPVLYQHTSANCPLPKV